MSIAEGIYPAWSNKHKIVALIPAYNEERFIGSVVLKAGRLVDRVIVVDDGSEDATAEVARAAGAIVIRHLHNIGKGAALNTGFRKICESDADVVVCIDGDGPFYDSSEYYDHLHRARTQAAFRPSYLLDNMGGLLKNAITLVAL
ncbi:MAG: glycosyltransferase family 2 protein, partial [Candidatus Promineifilaceae bacterium]